MGSMKEQAMKDLKSKKFWLQCIAEFLGTVLLVYGIEATSNYNAHLRIPANGNHTKEQLEYRGIIAQQPVQRGIIIGCIVLALHRFFGPASGGYFNPAITMSSYFSGDLCTLRASMYAGFQYLGGILGAGIHYLLTPNDQQLFGTQLHSSISVWRGFFIEFMLSFFLALVYLSRDSKYGKKNYAESAIIIGLTYIALNAIGEVYTGASINPSRALGVPIVTGVWPVHGYIYYLAPYFGAGFAGGFYRLFYDKFFFADETEAVNTGPDIEVQ